MGLPKQQLPSRLKSSCIVYLACRRNGVEVSRGHLLNDLATRRHLGEVCGIFRRAGRSPTGNHRAGEEHLPVVNLALGQVVLGDK